MTLSGLDVFVNAMPKKIAGKTIGVLCHAASVTRDYTHILDAISKNGSCRIGAVFGPQHGLFGQTQDNMVEWEGGGLHPVYRTPVYSLYGKTRKPTDAMLASIDALVIDLQDVGARPYTYVWTVKLCMEACAGHGIPVWILDRPNPIAALGFDGPLLRGEYFSFVGGAQIPLCHRLTIGEIAVAMQQLFFPALDLQVVWMKRWRRDSLFAETGLPWVIPSPNMPSPHTALVYPGMVLFEATNLSEGRGTTIPFELFGAPFLNARALKKELARRNLPGCIFREHGFIPTFQKWQGTLCDGLQIHVTQPRQFRPVLTAVSIIEAVMQSTAGDAFAFKEPPYEYEHTKMPFDILAGDSRLRESLCGKGNLRDETERWEEETRSFMSLFTGVAHYPDGRA